MSIGRILREPLLHFLLIGLALFFYYGHVAPGSSDDRRIVVSQVQVDQLALHFQATWNRPPTTQELAGIVDGYVSEEVLYREGKALGLDRDDPIIKRRVRQKLEVMAEEAGERTTPTEADLAAYLHAHQEQYVQPAIVSFKQLYFDPSKAGAESRMNAAKAALAAGRTDGGLGEPTMLPHTVDSEGIDIVARDFGADFATALGTLPLGQWTGPLRSAYGMHLVRVGAWTPSVVRPLDAVRQEVQRDWEGDRRQRAFDASYQKLLANYDVVIETKPPGAQ